MADRQHNSDYATSVVPADGLANPAGYLRSLRETVRRSGVLPIRCPRCGGGPSHEDIREAMAEREVGDVYGDAVRTARTLMANHQCPEPEAPADSIWLGDLAGFTVEADDVGTLTLEHRCGWQEDIGPADHFLANIAARAIEVRKQHRCDWPNQAIPREPAPAAAELEDDEPCCDDADELSSHYHCAKCGQRCSMMGHKCPEAKQ